MSSSSLTVAYLSSSRRFVFKDKSRARFGMHLAVSVIVAVSCGQEHSHSFSENRIVGHVNAGAWHSIDFYIGKLACFCLFISSRE